MARRKKSAWTLTVTIIVVLVAGVLTLVHENEVFESTVPSSHGSPGHETPAAPAAPDSATPLPVPGVDYADVALRAAALRTIDPAAPVPDYRREDFGDAWRDIDGNGCRQRDDVLARDLTDVVRDERGCTVLFGTLADPYTGQTVTFQHDRVAEAGNPGSQGVQIDHIVSLAAAHRGGAWTWTPGQREWFANNLDGLAAVEGRANQAKQDEGPSGWLPTADHVCTYVLEYTTILDEWDLGVSQADQDALIRTLTECAGVF